ncbi:MAG: hypothetical protein JRJ66_01540 [Deltaproteobacteria bacterium]|nr:hypothetical protein [Deltaproteobacteria bacterium]
MKSREVKEGMKIKVGDWVKTPGGRARVKVLYPPYAKVLMDQWIWVEEGQRRRRTRVMVYRIEELRKT